MTLQEEKAALPAWREQGGLRDELIQQLRCFGQGIVADERPPTFGQFLAKLATRGLRSP